MDKQNYFLNKNDYSLRSILGWGCCVEHARAAWRNRSVVHGLIALVEMLPIVSQVASIAEYCFFTCSPQNQQRNWISIEPNPENVSSCCLDTTHAENGGLFTFTGTREEAVEKFGGIKSNTLVETGLNAKGEPRQVFLRAEEKRKWKKNPVFVSASPFMTQEMAQHLFQDIKESALGKKYEKGDKITNMEGALRTFSTPIVPITISGDRGFDVQSRRHVTHPFEENLSKGRNVILSAAVHPDFEKPGKDEVVMKIIELKDEEIHVKDIENPKPLWTKVNGNKKEFEKKLKEHENSLQKFMIYHLTHDHKLPKKTDVKPIQPHQAIEKIENIINTKNSSFDEIKNMFVEIKQDTIISLEALFNIYVHQIRNEFSVLEQMLPQGYVYTVSPPNIFARQLMKNPQDVHHVSLLNRLQILALKYIHEQTPLKNLRKIGFENFRDSNAVDLLNTIFSHMAVSTSDLYQKNGKYSVQEDWALVLHNNSDAFGDNIRSERDGDSLDGAIGANSDGAVQLDTKRNDLLIVGLSQPKN